MCYVGVLGDFNFIYYCDDVVVLVGLLGVFVYGMLMMGIVLFVVIFVFDFVMCVFDYGVCFIKLVVVDFVDGVDIYVVVMVGVVDEEVVCIDFKVMFDEIIVFVKV